MAINANANEYKSLIGLDNIYVALVTEDSVAAYTADTPANPGTCCRNCAKTSKFAGDPICGQSGL